MNYNLVKFKASYGASSQLPPSTLPEIAFVGRSNVGKSSLINKLFNRKKLAYVSQTPGKTSTINFYSEGTIDFVDLPGYGFAKVAKSEKSRWTELIEGYLGQDRRFALVVSLVDIRHPATELDLKMLDFLEERGLPYLITLTKADKLSRAQQNRQLAALREQLGLAPEQSVAICSAQNGQGIPELQKTFEVVCKEF